ncbi:MAG: reverse transcriptase family protein, partial [Planctomycetales bacterium]
VRRAVGRMIEQSDIREVALPLTADAAWDSSGWLHGTNRELSRHPQGRRIQQRQGVPTIKNLKQLRALLGINSPRQLGYFLLASDKDGGPYTRFTIPKRDGADRVICAPKPQLRWVQRRLLSEILARLPVHAAAHGFVPGRSTVTNAAEHQGSEILVKFDLRNFFPTIHYYRVLGMFASIGYDGSGARFQSRDDSRQVAPTLARLCCWTPDPTQWGKAAAPQGAPTSPAISNIVCRGLDARLDGLAQALGGVYTRYADDLTFSFKDQSANLGRFRWWVDQICHQEGFLVNQRKFRVIRRSQRQTVTGIVVNDVLRVPRPQRRAFRAMLHNCRKHGVASQARGNASFPDYLRGFASYIHMVHPEEGRRLLDEVNELLGSDNES